MQRLISVFVYTSLPLPTRFFCSNLCAQNIWKNSWYDFCYSQVKMPIC